METDRLASQFVQSIVPSDDYPISTNMKIFEILSDNETTSWKHNPQNVCPVLGTFFTCLYRRMIDKKDNSFVFNENFDTEKIKSYASVLENSNQNLDVMKSRSSFLLKIMLEEFIIPATLKAVGLDIDKLILEYKSAEDFNINDNGSFSKEYKNHILWYLSAAKAHASEDGILETINAVSSKKGNQYVYTVFVFFEMIRNMKLENASELIYDVFEKLINIK